MGRTPILGAVPWRPYEGPPVQPVEVLIERRCKWKKKDNDPETGKRRLGCENCGEAELHPDHLGAPPSLNEGGSGMERAAYQGLKRAWQRAQAEAMVAAGLPRGLEAVTVEVQIGFDQYRERDEGNLRWMIEKSLGDTLVHGYLKPKKADVHEALELGVKEKTNILVTVIPGGWLPDDSFWPTRRYSMGNLEGVHTPGESWTRFRFFPSTVPPVKAPHARELAQPSLL
jgi:hypothetical protein